MKKKQRVVIRFVSGIEIESPYDKIKGIDHKETKKLLWDAKAEKAKRKLTNKLFGITRREKEKQLTNKTI